MKQILLIGFMGAGKSTVGKMLANQLAVDFVDSDEVIVEKAGMTIAEYFEKNGEAAFRQLETDTLKELAAKPGIIATGGGIVTGEGNREALKEVHNVVFLKADPLVSLERIMNDDHVIRPLVLEKTSDEIVELFMGRLKFYEECADWHVDTSQLSPEEVCQAILNQVTLKNS